MSRAEEMYWRVRAETTFRRDDNIDEFTETVVGHERNDSTDRIDIAVCFVRLAPGAFAQIVV
jgi:hypothetical protein